MKILVVEDEKMIRQGIVAMIKRSGVEIDSVMECKNGVEAMEILNCQKLDIVFTDIRMPKMDGVTLLKEMQNLTYHPHIVVISGYEDFSYAVEAMRNGVEDYILKPIEREKITEILEKCQKSFISEQEQNSERTNISCQQIKYFLLNQGISEGEMEAIVFQYKEDPLFEDFFIWCLPKYSDFDIGEKGCRKLDDVEGNTVMIISEQAADTIWDSLSEEFCIGVSKKHCGIGQIQIAYQEAVDARIHAFLKGGNICYKERERKEYLKHIPSCFGEQFVHRLGTQQFDQDISTLEGYTFYARREQLSIGELMDLLEEIPQRMMKTYGQLVEGDPKLCKEIIIPLSFVCVKDYLETLKTWLEDSREHIITELEGFQKREQMNRAIRYIEENYDKNLNMAMVSNHISMNYSLFSITFKQFTGVNFVSYLKDIRIREAKKLLSTTEDKIIDISRKVGYDNEKHFMKTFKHVCGASPSAYRKNLQIKR